MTSMHQRKPPHVRGRHTFVGLATKVVGFTPACAGNTTYHQIQATLPTVHPRMCGEYLVVRALPLRVTGSPPRARGILLPELQGPHGGRFTPACAGNTPAPIVIHTRSLVHPRVRGEYSESEKQVYDLIGSPPRARGILTRHRPGALAVGFTPACAGNTFPAPFAIPRCTVHPRVRGEYASPVGDRAYNFGSPPRARGIPVMGPVLRVGLRFTPACAGNTLANC